MLQSDPAQAVNCKWSDVQWWCCHYPGLLGRWLWAGPGGYQSAVAPLSLPGQRSSVLGPGGATTTNKNSRLKYQWVYFVFCKVFLLRVYIVLHQWSMWNTREFSVEIIISLQYHLIMAGAAVSGGSGGNGYFYNQASCCLVPGETARGERTQLGAEMGLQHQPQQQTSVQISVFIWCLGILILKSAT